MPGRLWLRTTISFLRDCRRDWGIMPGQQLPLVGGSFCDESGYAEVESFFKERVKSMPGAELSLAQVLEKIQLCGPRRAAQRPEVAKFLKGW